MKKIKQRVNIIKNYIIKKYFIDQYGFKTI